MKIFNLDEEGFLIGENEAELDPLEKKPMIPARATVIKPPVQIVDKVQRFESGKWQQVADNRGVWYMADGSKKENKSFLEVAGDTRTAPPNEQSKLVGGVWVADSAKIKADKNMLILMQIVDLENQITARVWRETTTKPNTPGKNGKTPAQFIADIDAQISVLRGTLQS